MLINEICMEMPLENALQFQTAVRANFRCSCHAVHWLAVVHMMIQTFGVDFSSYWVIGLWHQCLFHIVLARSVLYWQWVYIKQHFQRCALETSCYNRRGLVPVTTCEKPIMSKRGTGTVPWYLSPTSKSSSGKRGLKLPDSVAHSNKSCLLPTH